MSDPATVHFVYVIECGDGSLYTGYTTDVERRIQQHRDGDGAKYTRGRTPIDLVHLEAFHDQSTAQSREAEIKSLSRSEKEALVFE
jgi:putative endonuclease